MYVTMPNKWGWVQLLFFMWSVIQLQDNYARDSTTWVVLWLFMAIGNALAFRSTMNKKENAPVSIKGK